MSANESSAAQGGALEIRDLRITLPGRNGGLPILAGVNLSIAKGERLGVVGESGSGKSTTARSVVRMFPSGASVSGNVTVAGIDVLGLSGKSLRAYRSREVGMIYQDPRSRINPLRRIGDFLTEGMRHRGVTADEAFDQAVALLESVFVSSPARRMSQYPGELSGGLLQRVMIASVLAQSPPLILADEPTSALDVTTQEEVVAILSEACSERQSALLFITHDLDLAAAVTDRVAVMYAGRVVEVLDSARLHDQVRHPYTAALMRSRPSLHTTERIVTIPGTFAGLANTGPGCAFAARCEFATSRCREETPAMHTVGGSDVACHRAAEMDGLIASGASR